MTALWVEVISNIVVTALLVLTIAYCWVLNRRIKVLQDSRGELAKLIRHFDESTEKASNSVVALQTTSKKISEVIQERVEKANFMADDLAFLLDKAARSADRLEAAIAGARPQANKIDPALPPRRPAAPARPSKSEFAPQASALPVAESAPPRPPQRGTARETLASLGRPPAPEESTRERTNASLESVLERVTGKKEVSAPAAAEPVRPAAKEAPQPRSRAEQELLEIIKAGSRV